MEQFAPPPAPIGPTARGGFVKPADYYSSPPEQRGRGIPRPFQIGCGAAGLVFMLLLFLGANFVSTEGAGQFLGLLFGRLKGELVGMVAGDVSPQQKEALERQMDLLIRNTEQNHVNLVKVQPLLRQMNEAVRDQRLTAEEVNRLTRVLEEINAASSAKSSAP